MTETSVTTGVLVLGPAVDGYRYGTLTVTVRHGWGTRPANVVIEFYPPAGLERTGSAWPAIASPPTIAGVAATVTAPPVRGSASYTFAFRRPATSSGGTFDLEVGGLSAAHQRMSDANPWNNGAAVPLRIAN